MAKAEALKVRGLGWNGAGVLNSMKLLRLDGALPIDGRSQMNRAGWALDVGLGWADGSGWMGPRRPA